MTRLTESDLLRLLEEMKIKYEELSRAKKEIEDNSIVNDLKTKVKNLLMIISYLEKNQNNGKDEIYKRVKELEEENKELKNQISGSAVQINLVKTMKNLEELQEDYNTLVELNEEMEEENKQLKEENKELKEQLNKYIEQQDSIEELKRLVEVSTNNYNETHQLLVNIQNEKDNTQSEDLMLIQKRTEMIIHNQNERNNVFFKWSCFEYNYNHQPISRNGITNTLKFMVKEQYGGWTISFEYIQTLGNIIAIYSNSCLIFQRPYLCGLYNESTTLWIQDKGTYCVVTINDINEVTSYTPLIL
ncbi:hypothetical protein EDI_154000 [Entamoeba dispar SAW760]|uniref:Uncharacterized protein n=1 Tax=Entamoeba dispar (strain ATCC PRA-260 / SAW760) TaxID=370354 RepID=B0E5Z6_ENTDS|nr:uncharacterized protein EDI_154000 [Entamoeba dispar SAW760]EDR30033.1 hypothetical protein EDI_154000 [Entamoeba dispar SAW760]|eukprot:EDR30033.1 hypothetical protein EDI_154000 [Entamoeba dispar SAW760]